MILSTLMLLSKVSDLMDNSRNDDNLPIFKPRKTSWQIIKDVIDKTWKNIENYCKYIKKGNKDKADKLFFKIKEGYEYLVQNPILDAPYVDSDILVFKSFIEKGFFYNDILDKTLNKRIISKFEYRELIDGYDQFEETDPIDKEVDKLINLTPLQKQVLKLQRHAEYKIEVYKKYLPNHVDEVIKEIEEFEKEIIYNFEEQNPQLKNANNNTNQQTTNNVDVQKLMHQNQQLQQQMAQMQQQMNQLLQQQNKATNPSKVIDNMLNREK